MFDPSYFSIGLPEDVLIQKLDREEKMLQQKAEMIDRKWRRMKKLPILSPDAYQSNSGSNMHEPSLPPTIESIRLKQMERQRKIEEQEAEIVAMEYEAEMEKDKASLKEPSTLDELFLKRENVEPALQLLRNKGIIDTKNCCISKQSKAPKAIISAWIISLREHMIIREVSNTKTAELVKKKLSLNSFHASTLNPSKTERNKKFEKLISDFRLAIKNSLIK